MPETEAAETTTRVNNPFAPFLPQILDDVLRPAVVGTIEKHGDSITSFNDLFEHFRADHYGDGQTISKSKFKEWLDGLDIHVNRSVNIHLPSE